MTPTHSSNAAQSATHGGARVFAEQPYSDAPQYLTLDEMRELPMRLALGFDTED